MSNLTEEENNTVTSILGEHNAATSVTLSIFDLESEDELKDANVAKHVTN
jgi:hypothetical protein